MQSLPSQSVPTCSRRHAIAALAAAAAGVAAAPLTSAQSPTMAQMPASDDHKNLTSIHDEIDFKAAPMRFYQAILDQKQFTAFTGLTATIEPKPGGAFSLFGGLIQGRNIELVPNQRIVQAWRPDHWDPGVYSIVRFELKPRGEELTLLFDHIGFPAGEFDHLDFGWRSHYWEPLKKYFAT